MVDPLHAQPPPKPTSIILIDGTNLDRLCLERFGRNDIDFEKLLPTIAAGAHLLHTFYVTAPYKREIDEMRYRIQTGMLNHLKRIPNVTVNLQQHRYRDVTCRHCGHRSRVPKEKGTDVAVASLLVEAAILNSADELILVANDVDYAPAFKIARKYGRKCVLACVIGGEKPHNLRLSLAPLWNESNRVILLDGSVLSNCWMQTR